MNKKEVTLIPEQHTKNLDDLMFYSNNLINRLIRRQSNIVTIGIALTLFVPTVIFLAASLLFIAMACMVVGLLITVFLIKRLEAQIHNLTNQYFDKVEELAQAQEKKKKELNEQPSK